MTPLAPSPELSAPISPLKEIGQLYDLQMSVARRADRLAQGVHPSSPESDRQVWLRAELEIFEAAEPATQASRA